MAERGERLVALLVPLRKHDHEWPRAIGHPRHGDPNVGVDALMHDLHGGIPGVESDAVTEIANAQRHVGEPEVGHRLTLLGKTLGTLCTNPVARLATLRGPVQPTGLHSARRPM